MTLGRCPLSIFCPRGTPSLSLSHIIDPQLPNPPFHPRLLRVIRMVETRKPYSLKPGP